MEPTDAAWPKWAGYAAAGVAAGAIIYYAGEGNENYPGPWSYTKPDPTSPFYNPNSNYNFGDKDPLIPGTPWEWGFLFGALNLLHDYNTFKQDIESKKFKNQPHPAGQDATQYYIQKPVGY